MSRTLTPADFDLLGYQKVDVVVDSSASTVFRASVSAGLALEHHAFIYVKSGCTNDQFADAVRQKQSGPLFVIVPKHQQERIRHLEKMAPSTTRFFIHEDMTWEKTRATFAGYLQSLVDELPTVEHYVTPRPVGNAKAELDREVVDWLTRTQEAQTRIKVLRAHAGVGKTTVARYITRRIAAGAERFRTIPVYVEASHWARIVENLGDLWSTIDNSLRHFDPSIRLTNRLFDHLLGQGDIVFIFDGFDELCGHRLSPLSARAVLDELAVRVASASSARVLLTSRTTYWDTEVGAVDNVEPLELAPFTKDQAFDYIQKRFRRTKALQEKARQLFGQLRAANQPVTKGGGYKQIVYHPLVVQLISDSAEFGVDQLDQNEWGRSDMLRILYSFCDREIQRQKLETSPNRQLDAFQELAVDLHPKDEKLFDADLLVAAGFDERDRGKLADHPLISTVDGVQLCTRYEFQSYLLLARYLTNRLVLAATGEREVDTQLLQIMDLVRSGKSPIFEHLCDLWTEEVNLLASAFRAISSSQLGPRSFLFHLVKLLVDMREHPSLKADRTKRVFEVLGAITTEDVIRIRDVAVTGSIERFDLRGCRFVNCHFTDVTFSDCEADDSTAFVDCAFEGEFEIVGGSSRGWASAVRQNCKVDAQARLQWADLSASFASDVDAIRDGLAMALSKFWKHGKVKRTITTSDWSSGPVSRLKLNSDIRAAMLKTGLINAIEISGVTGGGYLIAQDAIGDIQQFMDNRQVTGRIAEVMQLLRRRSR